MILLLKINNIEIIYMETNNINNAHKIIQLQPIITEGKPGSLIDLNITNICLKNNIQFNISKCFYINDLDSFEARGKHSNENASEILVCVNGSFKIMLHDGINEYNYTINKNTAIYIDKNIWIEMNDFHNCVIMAFVHIYPNDKQSCFKFEDFLEFKNK